MFASLVTWLLVETTYDDGLSASNELGNILRFNF